MNKLVIFEGLDRCYKSTNVKSLAKEFFRRGQLVQQLHYTSTGIQDSEECIRISKLLYNNIFQLSYICHDSSYICDRCHGGEWVYGKIYRNYSANYIFELENSWMKIGQDWWKNDVHLITLYDDAVNLVNRDDGNSYSNDLLNKEMEIERFLDFHLKSNIRNKLLLKVTNESKEKLSSMINKFIFGDI